MLSLMNSVSARAVLGHHSLVVNVTVLAPQFLSSTAFGAPEGSAADYVIALSEACDVSLSGGAALAQYQLVGQTSGVTSVTLRLAAQTYVGGANTFPVGVKLTSNATGLTTTATFTGTVAALPAPTNTAAPSIPTNLVEGGVYVVTPGTWTGAEAVNHQLYSGGTAVSGATALSFTPQMADVGNTMFNRETATSGGGIHSTTRDSNVSAAVANGIVAWVGLRSTAAFVTDVARSTYCLLTDTDTATTRAPTGPAPAGTYGFYVGGTLSLSNTNATYPAYLAGAAAISGSTGYVAVRVPVNTPVNVRVALGAISSATDATHLQSVVIRDGTTSGTILGQVSNVSLAVGQVGDIAGTAMAYSSWLAQAGHIQITSTTGLLIFKYNSVANNTTTLRCIEVTRPEYSVNKSTAGLTGNTAYIDPNSGNDVTGDGTTVKPFQHIPGDPGASGVVPAFNIAAGGFVKLRTGTYRPLTYTGRLNNSIIQTTSLGTSGNLVTIAADAGATPIIDGTVPITTSPITSADTGGAWENPNRANLRKAVGLTGTRMPPVDGSDWMFAAQFPNPFNPADCGLTYLANDGFIALTNADLTAGVLTQGQTGQYDQYGDAFVSTSTMSRDGVNTQVSSHKITYTHPAIRDHYSADNIVLSNNSSARAVVHIGGNRLNELRIFNHNPATGYFECYMPDSVTLFLPTQYQTSWLAVRYHPYDIRKPGQYAFNSAGDIYGHWATTTYGRLSPDLGWAWAPTNDYNAIDGLTLRGVGNAGTGVTGGSYGGAISDMAGTSTARKGLKVLNTHITQCVANNQNGRLIVLNAGAPGNYTTGLMQNLTIDNCQTSAGVNASSQVAFDGLYVRDLDGTVFFTSIDLTAYGGITHKNLDFCDMQGVHANGVAAYLKTGGHTFTQMLMLNLGIPFSTQGGDGSSTRSNTFKNGYFLPRRGYTDPATGAFTAPTSGYTWQFDYAETGMLAEGLLCAGPAAYGRSTGTNIPSTGGVVKNCVFFDFIAQLDVAGLTFQDCLFCCMTNQSSYVRSISDITGTGRGGTDGGGNVFLPAGTFVSTGFLTSDMQKALTYNRAGGNYLPRNIGLEPTAFNGVSKPLIVPAFGASFQMTDQPIWLSTSTVRKTFRPGADFAVLGCPFPDVTATLPSGQGDNALFSLNGCYVSFGTTAGTGGVATTLHLVVDFTTTNSHVTGSPTIRVTFPITVV